MTDQLIVLKDGLPSINPTTEQTLANFERMKAQIEDQEKRIRAQLLTEMIEFNYLRVEGKELIITRIDATDRETFDSKRFRNDHPDLYDEYVNITRVRPQLRMKVK